LLLGFYFFQKLNIDFHALLDTIMSYRPASYYSIVYFPNFDTHNEVFRTLAYSFFKIFHKLSCVLTKVDIYSFRFGLQYTIFINENEPHFCSEWILNNVRIKLMLKTFLINIYRISSFHSGLRFLDLIQKYFRISRKDKWNIIFNFFDHLETLRYLSEVCHDWTTLEMWCRHSICNLLLHFS